MTVVKAHRRGSNLPRLLLVVTTVVFIVAYLSRYPSMTTLHALASRRELIDVRPSAGLRLIRARGAAAPRWCARLAARPRTFNKHKKCQGSRLSDAGNLKCGRFFSQYDQDVWVWQSLARFMTLPGVYVDVGTNSPAQISNTYFLDRCLGWRGVCVEGQTRYHAALEKHRTCSVHACASDKEETVPFLQARNLGGISSVNKNINGTREFQQKAKLAESVMTRCRPLSDILADEGIAKVSYMSVDVEGAEMKILGGIDFDRTEISLINVEGRNAEAREFLESRGFRLLRMTDDSFFASEKVIEQIEQLKGQRYLSKIKLPTK